MPYNFADVLQMAYVQECPEQYTWQIRVCLAPHPDSHKIIINILFYGKRSKNVSRPSNGKFSILHQRGAYKRRGGKVHGHFNELPVQVDYERNNTSLQTYGQSVLFQSQGNRTVVADQPSGNSR